MSQVLNFPIDEVRLKVTGQLDPRRRAALGQFMTPAPIATFMASLFHRWPRDVSVLDPGAGLGSLSEAFADRFSNEAESGSNLHITAYEIEPILASYLAQHVQALAYRSKPHHGFESHLLERDFIKEAAFASGWGSARYTHVIMNPPYKKMAASSEYRHLLRRVGVETVNLYTAFVALAVLLTEEGGEIVAIIPRSFCNGAYFRPFRTWLLDRVALTHLHVFESRKKAFSDDDVLQENIIVRLQRGVPQASVTVSSSHDQSLSDYTERAVPFAEIVKPIDEQRFIHIPTSGANVSHKLFSHTLHELGLDVATGPVVDFRLKEHCSPALTSKSVPLLYAHHFTGGDLHWPREHKKPNAIAVNEKTSKWLMPAGWYAVTKRFSAKEERRRVVAYVVDAGKLPFEFYGFENHLNVIHAGKQGLRPELARGLALFLNSTLVDEHFRTFSGHTQVNATDLRSMYFPSKSLLTQFGKWAEKQGKLSQAQIDRFIETCHGD